MKEIRLTVDRNSMIVIILSHAFFFPRVPSARIPFLRSIIPEERRPDMLIP